MPRAAAGRDAGRDGDVAAERARPRERVEVRVRGALERGRLAGADGAAEAVHDDDEDLRVGAARKPGEDVRVHVVEHAGSVSDVAERARESRHGGGEGGGRRGR